MAYFFGPPCMFTRFLCLGNIFGEKPESQCSYDEVDREAQEGSVSFVIVA